MVGAAGQLLFSAHAAMDEIHRKAGPGSWAAHGHAADKRLR